MDFEEIEFLLTPNPKDLRIQSSLIGQGVAKLTEMFKPYVSDWEEFISFYFYAPNVKLATYFTQDKLNKPVNEFEKEVFTQMGKLFKSVQEDNFNYWKEKGDVFYIKANIDSFIEQSLSELIRQEFIKIERD